MTNGKWKIRLQLPSQPPTIPPNSTLVSIRNSVLKICYLCIEQAARSTMTGHQRRKVMSYTLDTKTDQRQPTIYQIRVKGHLGSQWTDWFGGLTVTLEDNGETLLTGPVADQAALHGLIKKVRDLGMPLVSVVSVVQ